MILTSFTTEYIEQEDRLRLVGSFEQGKVVVWLTLRLLQRLLPLFVRWLEQQQAHACNTVTAFRFT